jgi:hypothetical protein
VIFKAEKMNDEDVFVTETAEAQSIERRVRRRVMREGEGGVVMRQ